MDILLFSHEPDYAAAAVDGGVAGVLVDWEWRGKGTRQAGWDTQINHGTAEDLCAIAAVAQGRASCRINNQPGQREIECDLAIACGASEILLPMARRVDEIESLLRHVDGRAAVSVLVETAEAMGLGRELARLPLARVYVGLHDYRIDTGGLGLFDPLIDGTIDRFRDTYPGSFGVAGVTCVQGGHPVPQRLLLAAMARLDCDFGVARRAFRRDVEADGIGVAVACIQQEMQRLCLRGTAEISHDHSMLAAAIAELKQQDCHSSPVEAAACVR